MKKLLSVFLSAVMTLSFAACATASAASDTTKTTAAASMEETESETITGEITLSDKTGSVTITEAGVYHVTGSLTDGQILVDAQDAQVTLILDGVDITAKGTAAIYVAEADKVKIELAAGSKNTLTSTGAFADKNDESIDAVIFSHDDVTVKGEGSLTVKCEQGHGIVSKDDLKVTGGTLEITAAKKGLCGNDSVEIKGGDLTIQAGSDGIHCDATVTVNGGMVDITASEGIEATYVEINDGDITIAATDDGINASQKSTDYEVAIVVNGGTLTITMGQGDTDALDSNGALIINGGTVDITAQFAFDYDTTGVINGGTVTVNGNQVTTLTNSMMMGGMGGFGGGQMGGFGGRGEDFGGQDGSYGGQFSGGMGGFGGPGGRH